MYLFREKATAAVKIKVCGLARKEDIDNCIHLRVDALGFLLGNAEGKSPTDKLTPGEAATLVEYVNGRTKSVLLVKSILAQEIAELLNLIKPNAVQLQHVELPPPVLMELKTYFPSIEWIKTVKVQPGEQAVDIRKHIQPFEAMADAILLDSSKAGSGVSPDWVQCRTVAEYFKPKSIPFVLAGGLTPLKVKEALTYFEPFTPAMVDVMSGVSTGIGTGIKNINAVTEFVAAVRQFNS